MAQDAEANGRLPPVTGRCGQKELGSLCWIPGSHRNEEVIQRHGGGRGGDGGGGFLVSL